MFVVVHRMDMDVIIKTPSTDHSTEQHTVAKVVLVVAPASAVKPFMVIPTRPSLRVAVVTKVGVVAVSYGWKC